MAAFLVGEKTYLRAISLADATEDYLSWVNDPEVTKGLVTGVYPSNMEDLRQYISAVSADKGAHMLAICDKESEKHIGNIKLDRIDPIGRTGELGIMIGDSSFWGKGIGTEACKLLLNYAFDELNLRKVALTVFDNNPGAIRLYEKIGFKVEGRLRKHVFADGEFYDKLWMGIFKEEVK